MPGGISSWAPGAITGCPGCEAWRGVSTVSAVATGEVWRDRNGAGSACRASELVVCARAPPGGVAKAPAGGVTAAPVGGVTDATTGAGISGGANEGCVIVGAVGPSDGAGVENADAAGNAGVPSVVAGAVAKLGTPSAGLELAAPVAGRAAPVGCRAAPVGCRAVADLGAALGLEPTSATSSTGAAPAGALGTAGSAGALAFEPRNAVVASGALLPEPVAAVAAGALAFEPKIAVTGGCDLSVGAEPEVAGGVAVPPDAPGERSGADEPIEPRISVAAGRMPDVVVRTGRGTDPDVRSWLAGGGSVHAAEIDSAGTVIAARNRTIRSFESG